MWNCAHELIALPCYCSFNYLVATRAPSRHVHWVNANGETKAPYDITISPQGTVPHRGGSRSENGSVFIEVKTTRYLDKNVFELSYFEWEFLSTDPPVQYHIYHVAGAGSPCGTRLTIIENPLQAVKDGMLKLCMAI